MTDFEKTLRQCWQEEQGAMAAERPEPSPSFRNIFTKAYSYGKAATKTEPVSNPDKFGNFEQLRALIAKDLYIGGLNHPDGALRHQCYQNRRQHAKECVDDADILLAELDKTKDNG